MSGSGSVGESGTPALATGTVTGAVESPAPLHPPPPIPGSGLGGAGAGARFLEASLALREEPAATDGVADEEEVLRRESAAKDILADLDALQREVDALRAAQEQGRTV